jgi:hypothetical protein
VWFLFNVPNPPNKEAALGNDPYLEVYGVRLAFDDRYVIAFARIADCALIDGKVRPGPEYLHRYGLYVVRPLFKALEYLRNRCGFVIFGVVKGINFMLSNLNCSFPVKAPTNERKYILLTVISCTQRGTFIPYKRGDIIFHDHM